MTRHACVKLAGNISVVSRRRRLGLISRLCRLSVSSQDHPSGETRQLELVNTDADQRCILSEIVFADECFQLTTNTLHDNVIHVALLHCLVFNIL